MLTLLCVCAPCRNRLTNFYTKHNPAKLDEIEDLLKKYEGNEELLFTRLHRKYNALAGGVDATGKKIVSKDFDESDFLYEEEEEVVAYEEERAQEADNEESGSANERSAAGGSSGDGESESEEGFQVVKAPLSPSFAKRPSPLSPSSVSTSALEPPSTPTGTAVTSDKSSRIQAAIQEAKRAQEERIQQRIAQLEARANASKH